MTLQDGTTELLADCMLQLSQCRTLQEIYKKRLIFTKLIFCGAAAQRGPWPPHS